MFMPRPTFSHVGEVLGLDCLGHNYNPGNKLEGCSMICAQERVFSEDPEDAAIGDHAVNHVYHPKRSIILGKKTQLVEL